MAPDAVESARASASDLRRQHPDVGPIRFTTADATAHRDAGLSAADLVIVNPPRRGIGPDLAGRLEESVVGDVIYSSCNVDSLARDLAAMPSFCVQEARLFDMFPQTNHHEVMVRLHRT